MPLSASGYFQSLRSCLNLDYYGTEGIDGELKLVEHIFIGSGKAKIMITLRYSGEAFAVKLDVLNKRGNHEPLFHFLTDTAKPWARRCDFVILHLTPRRIKLYCMELKWTTLDAASVADQLSAGVAWCRTMCAAIKNYTRLTRRVSVAKFVLSRHPDPERYLDRTGRYLQRDSTVRHYTYDEIEGKRLGELENVSEETLA
jgi:hypothetical protein